MDIGVGNFGGPLFVERVGHLVGDGFAGDFPLGDLGIFRAWRSGACALQAVRHTSLMNPE